MESRNNTPDLVKTTEKAFRILELLREHDGLRVSELAAQSGMAKSSAHRHLSTLREMKYVVKEGDTYYISLKFQELSDYASARKVGYRLSRPVIEELAEETGERAQFIVEEHGIGTYLHVQRGSKGVEISTDLGDKLPLHAGAAGKAILASYPEDRQDEIIEAQGLPQITENTITDRETLERELATVAESGYSINDEETTVGLRSIGVVVVDTDGTTLGALSISGPTHRMKDDLLHEDLPDLLQGAANELELNILFEKSR